MVMYEHALQLPIAASSALLLLLNTKKIQRLSAGMLAGARGQLRTLLGCCHVRQGSVRRLPVETDIPTDMLLSLSAE